MEFTYNLPVNLIFGSGKISVLGAEAKKYGYKALIVTGQNSTKKTGLLERAISLLSESGLKSVVYDQVEPNPLTTTSTEGAAIAKKEGCDVIIGLGGGSIMDAAKAIAFLANNDGNISDYIFGASPKAPALPIILVPTTCGTGSEGNGFAVLTNPDTGDKKSLRGNFIVAKTSIIDPTLMMTMPKHVLASVGFDALCHCMEAYISKIAQPLTDMMALSGISLLADNLVKLYKASDTTDIHAWEAVTWASTLGGMVIHTAAVTAPHGMEHPASGLKNIVHGMGLAALTPVIFEESINATADRFANISVLLGGKNETDLVPKLKELLEELHMTTSLSALGITVKDVEWMADNCLKVSAVGLSLHPVTFKRDDLIRLYKKAL